MRHGTPLHPTPIPNDDETAALEASRKHLKPEHIGQFDPGRKGQSQSKGLISGPKGSIYTDPFLFADRLWAVEDTYGFVTLKTLLPILLIGDAAWHMDGVRLMKGKDAPWITEDQSAVMSQLKWLNELARSEPRLVIVASHDDEEHAELIKKGVLGGRFELRRLTSRLPKT